MHRNHAGPGPVRRSRYIGVLAAVCLLLPAVPGSAAAQPAADSSLVTVHTGGDRIGTRSVAPLDGVELALFTDEAATQPVQEEWATCVSVGGLCEFEVPDTDGERQGDRYWVSEVAAPDGWYSNPELRTGRGSGSASVATPYRFQTPALQAGETYTSTSDFMYAEVSAGARASEGIWQDSRENPPLERQCGVDVALVLDLSASVGSDLPQLKQAADTFADSLVGTPSRMAVFSFDGSSPPGRGGGENLPDLVPVSTQEGADAFKNQYADWQLGSGTNWDRGIYAVAEAEQEYEVALVITDGNPTRFSAPPMGDGSNTHIRDVENGIYSANAVKAEGTRLAAFGVGSGLDEISGLNLRAISGQNGPDSGADPLDTDYFQISDYEAAGQILSGLMSQLCSGSLTVVKQLVPEGNEGEDVSGSTPAGAGWNFSASSTDPDVGGLPAAQTTTGDGTGSVNFEIVHPTGDGNVPVTVEEAQQPGHTLVTRDGNNAECFDLDDGSPVESVNTGSAEQPGFEVDMPAGAAVSCTVHNKPEAEASIEVDKRWIIDGTEYTHAERPPGFEADLALTGPGEAGSTPQDWGTERDGYTAGDEVTVSEEVDVSDERCSVTGSRITEANGEPADEALPADTVLEAGENTYTVTNEVDCVPDRTELTLVKEVENQHGGSASPEEWTLSAQGPTPISGTSGEAEVTSASVEPGHYQLSESEGPAGYTASPWTCSGETGDQTEVADDTVTLAEGSSTTCTVVNTRVPELTPSPSPTESPTPTESPSPGEPTTAPPAEGNGPQDGEGDASGPLPRTGPALAALVTAALLSAGLGTLLLLKGRRRSRGV